MVNEIGYRSVPYSEDYEYGKDILDAGYMKAYNSDAIVEHSNDFLLSEYKQRIFDETYNVRRNSGVTTPISVSTVLIQFLKSSVKDAMKIVSDQDYSWKRKLYWLAVNPLFHFEKWRGMRLANSVDMTKDNSKHSLENSKSKG